MVERLIDLASFARALDARAKGNDHAVAELQSIRTNLKALGKRPGSKIFSTQTVYPTYAFHHGGRSELQFNIGVEETDGVEELRHGVAFSFERSHALPSIDVLVPKARLFNEYLHFYPDAYADMRMWHFQNGQRSGDYSPAGVVPELVRDGTFVFLGKRQPADGIDIDLILQDFDRLLALYLYVEGGGREEAAQTSSFKFRAGCTRKAPATKGTLAQRELDIALLHNRMQAALTARLIAQYGLDNVADEHPSGLGTKIDVVVRRSDSEFWYYEIKTSLLPRACIREAIGQLLEYAYWPGSQHAKRLAICGGTALDKDGEAYLAFLNKQFGLAVEYEHIELSST